jgi:hypothetical protein
MGGDSMQPPALLFAECVRGIELIAFGAFYLSFLCC